MGILLTKIPNYRKPLSALISLKERKKALGLLTNSPSYQQK
jgi:FMN phosphatase YigB (HAD superfamily)